MISGRAIVHRLHEHGVSTGAMLGVSAWAVAVVAAMLVERFAGKEVTLCVFKRVTGSPCPMCGSTRATALLARGDVGAAAVMNPLFVAVVAAAIVWGVWMIVRARTARRSRAARGAWMSGPWAAAALLVVVGINWAYVLWRGN